MDDGAHSQRVVGHHPGASTQYIGRSGASRTGDNRRTPQPPVEVCDAGVELIDVVSGRETFYRSERFCVHRDGIEPGSSA